MTNVFNTDSIYFAIALSVIVFVVIMVCYSAYKMFLGVEPDEPDAVRLGIIPTIVIHADARIVPIQTTATFIGTPDHYVHDAVYVEEIKEAEPPMGENMV